MAGLKFDVKVDTGEWESRFDAIGSTRFPKALAFCIHQTGKFAVDNMREIMPQVLQKGLKRSGHVDPLSNYTIKAIRYDRDRGTKYSDVKDVNGIYAAVYVADTPGKRGSDQSAYLKYLFGIGSQIREPGDVSLDTKKILIPRALAQNVAIDPSWAGGRLPPGMMKTVLSHLVKPGGTASRSEAMKLVGARKGGRFRTPAEVCEFALKGGV